MMPTLLKMNSYHRGPLSSDGKKDRNIALGGWGVFILFLILNSTRL